MTDPTSLPNFMPSAPDAGPTASPNGASASDAPVRDRILEVLKGLGIEASVDGDGDLEFAIVDDQGTSTTLFARVAEGDLALVRFFGQWQLAEPVSSRCNELTMQLNVVKLSLVQESLVVSAEHVVTPNADLDILVPLSVNHILQSVGFFFQSWLPIDDAPAGTPGDA